MRSITVRSSPVFASALVGLCTVLAGAPASLRAQNAGAPAASEQQRQADEAVHSPSGKAGTHEPSANVPTHDQPVLSNGALNVPGAPSDSQTIPAKFSERNAALDKLPTLAFQVR
jgi:hypothetical protein